uniref:DNA-directed RNA polymerase subunit 5 n=1 Tax=Marseillevirus LCMAC103 TaxID=2506604 RepID=A0A481YW49_9VIRU|nr:MAG: DNA-directed RNA polymerase subunit 5 [Marseillevirus LCMAC103]
MDDAEYEQKKSKAVETIFEMMVDRELVQKPSPSEAKGDGAPLCFGRAGDAADDVAVFFARNPKVGIGHVQDIAARLQAAAKTRCILVVINPVSHKARGAIKNHRAQGVRFELYRLSELQYNPTRHVAVPSHRICTPAEAEKLYKTYDIKPREKFDKMKIIDRADAVMRYFGADRGQLIEIKRPSHTMPGFYEIDYRLVA